MQNMLYVTKALKQKMLRVLKCFSRSKTLNEHYLLPLKWTKRKSIVCFAPCVIFADRSSKKCKKRGIQTSNNLNAGFPVTFRETPTSYIALVTEYISKFNHEHKYELKRIISCSSFVVRIIFGFCYSLPSPSIVQCICRVGLFT